MKKSTQRILSLVLALVMVFGFALPVYAQTGERPDPKGTYTFNIEVTLNGLKGLVDGDVHFYLRGQTPNGEWMAYEFDQTAVITDGKGNAEVEIPAVIVDEDTGKEYEVKDLSNLEVWVGLGHIEDPVVVDFFHYEEVTPEYLDKYDDEMYWVTYPVADLDVNTPVNVVFDIVHHYDQVNDDEFVIRVVDRNGRGIEGAEIDLWQVLKGDDADYELDANGDYIVDEDADTWFVGRTDARGVYVMSAEQKQQAAAFLGSDDVQGDIVGALRARYGNLLTSTTFVNFADENNKALIVMSARDTHFKVTVVTRDEDRPFYALPGATVRIVENVGELWGAPAMGATLASGTTNANGEIVFTNVELTNVIQRNFPEFDFDDDDDLKLVIEDLIRNNWLVVEKDGYTRVERLITNGEIEEREATVVLLPTAIDYGRYVDRIEGDNRYATAVAVAKRTFPSIPDTFILASGENFPDALVANGLTNVFDAPILLTRQGELPAETAAYLAQAKAVHKQLHVHIVGGTHVISGAVEGELERTFSAVTSRMAGENRYETAALVARYMYTHNETVQRAALLANGEVFPDAIIASLPAAQYGKPILLTGPRELHPITDAVLKNELSFNHITVIGGPNVISDNVYGQLPLASKERLWGNNRYLTSLEALRQMYADATKLYVVSGEQYTDALVAAKLAADNNAAILLVSPDGLSEAATAYLLGSKITDITIIGGPNALPESVRAELGRILLSR